MAKKDELPQRMQSHKDAPPVTDNPRLARMDSGSVRPRSIKGKVLKMAETVDEHAEAQGQEPNRMAPFSGKAKDEKPHAHTETDQQPRKPDDKTAEAGEGYVRLRLHVEGGNMTVVGVHAVEGPLIRQERLQAELVFEVTRDQQPVANGNILDAGVSRGFPHPEGLPGMTGHSIVPEPGFDFTARIPKKDFSAKALARMQVVVYRTKGTLPEQPTLGTSLTAAHFSDQLREVARLDGIKLDQLSGEVQEQLNRALK